MRNIHLLAIAWLFVTTQVSALYLNPDFTNTLSKDEQNITKRALPAGFQFRIGTIGASIVNGYRSADMNGFRYSVRNQLIANGYAVNMVGSLQTGTMLNNNNEGWIGYVIDQVYDTAQFSIPFQPNLILLHVGSNDMTQGIDPANAHVRLARVIDLLFASIPGVTIVASTLLPRSDSGYEANTQVYNGNIPGMILDRQKAGKKVTYVDFSSSWWSTADLHSDDGLHPTDAGYQKMASVWIQGIQVAINQGWLTPPNPVAGLSDTAYNNGGAGSTTCDKIPGAAPGPYPAQKGSGADDGPYVHSGASVGGFSGFNNPVGTGFNNTLPEGVYWADINGDGVDDYVYIAENANLGIGVALNNGDGTLGTYLFFAFPNYCLRRGVRFADMTGDGRHDFCCLYPNGDLHCWQNTPGSDARSPNWVGMGLVKANQGYPQAQVRLADIDGDGRADYVAFDPDGTQIWGWRNGANQNGPPAYWYPMHGVISGLPALALSGWTFADLNGDHRADLVWVNAATGQVTTWINQRGTEVGLTPVWQSMGITHAGFGTQTNVTFGRFMGTGRADYSKISIGSNGNVFVDRWKNNDHGGTEVKGDGNHYCDMTGSGAMDYAWVNDNGDVTLYGNNHQLAATWDQWGIIYTIALSGRSRRDVLFADFDGDGKCDILLVDKASGATTLLHNEFANGKFAFSNQGVVTGSATCTEGYGYDLRDTGVRWADIDGDGRADFLCMQQNGVTTGYLNKGINNMVNQGQVKHAEGKERRNLRFADIDGDKRADLLWLDMITGQMNAWKNIGPIPAGGSSFSWTSKGMVATGGVYRGSSVELVNYHGIGRADYYGIVPQTNTADVWLNICPGGGVGPITPNLPIGAPAPPTVTVFNDGFWFGPTNQLAGGDFVQYSFTNDQCDWDQPADWGQRSWCDNVPLSADCNFADTSATSGSYHNMHWMSIDCDDPTFTSAMNQGDYATAWDYSQADYAFYQVRQCWIVPGFASVLDLGWSGEVFKYFRGPPIGVNCGAINDRGCIPQRCAAGDVQAAGLLIMNSFYELNNIGTLLDSQIDSAALYINGLLDADAIATFSPSSSPQSELWLQILLDVIGLGFAAVATPVWRAAMEASEAVTEENIDVFKDLYNAIGAFGVSVGKDSIQSATDPEDAVTDLKAALARIQFALKRSNQESLRQLFLGDPTDGTLPLDDSFNVLVTALKGGAQLYPLGNLRSYNATVNGLVISALSGTIIPTAWALSNQQHHPFIMTPSNGMGSNCQPPSDVNSWIETGSQADSLNCVGGVAYYIVTVPDGCHGCGFTTVNDPFPPHQAPILARSPPGINLLINETNVWGVTRDEMVQGSVNTATKYGNGYKPDLTQRLSFAPFSEKDFLKGAGGLFNFPVCTGAEALANLNMDGMADNPNYPCNSP